MRCISCLRLSFYIICHSCQKKYLTPSIYKREINNHLNISFYKYDEIKDLIKTKYEFYGDKIFHILAKNSFLYFSKNFNYHYKTFALAINDNLKKDFSHSAILTKYLKNKYIIPLLYQLFATNNISYAGKDKSFREKNKRNFKYIGHKDIDVILVDDIITTGNTILEAKEILKQYNVEVLFSLTLTDASL